MPLQGLSTIQDRSPELFLAISNVRELISVTGSSGVSAIAQDNLAEISDLLRSPLNQHGEFYKYYFDKDGVGDSQKASDNPGGNNLLLLSVARGAFNKVDRDTNVTKLVLNILHDAEAKLEPSELKEFISFKFIAAPHHYDAYWYDNSPLTLAIKTGMIEVAHKLVEMNADVNATSYGMLSPDQLEHGHYSALHLLLIRLPITQSEDELKLLDNLVKHGANLEKEDNFHRKAKDIANIHNLLVTDKKLFAFVRASEALECGMDGRDADGLIKAFSFKELAQSELFRNFYKSKTCVELAIDITEDKFHTFRENIKGLLTSSRHIQDLSKLCPDDVHQISYDEIFGGDTDINYDHILGSEVNHDVLHTYPHNDFHGTDMHKVICEIMGVTSPCPGGVACLM